jgi:hypothetical protein
MFDPISITTTSMILRILAAAGEDPPACRPGFCFPSGR